MKLLTYSLQSRPIGVSDGMRFASLLSILLIACGSISAVVELGADVSYFNPKLTAAVYPGLKTSETTGFSGPLFTGYGHLTFGLPKAITIGFGPTLAFSNQTALEYPTGYTKEEMTIARFGLDGKVQLELLPFISPYIRITAGKDWINWNDKGTVGSSTYIASSSAGGFYYSALVGAQFPFAPEFALYAQVGFTASPGSALVTKSYAVDGVNQTVNTSAAGSTSYSGLLLSAGARLSF